MKIEVVTNHRLCRTSPGGVSDNNRNPRFNDKLARLFNCGFTLMDYGCAGGAFVADCCQQPGSFAIGLEGNDYNLRRENLNWRTIPDKLFMADLTKPFQVLLNGLPARFDVVTSWELLHYIGSEEDLAQICENTRKHLKPTGLWIASISTGEETPFVETARSLGWWLNFFQEQGFVNNRGLVIHFGNEMVAGTMDGFHVVLKLK